MRKRLDLPQSGMRGVIWRPRQRKWKVSARIDGKQTHFGYFADLDDAIAARKAVEAEHPELAKPGLAQRRYPAPPGMRACANPDCTAGKDARGRPCRYVGPEDSFPPKGGTYRQGICRTCFNDRNRPRMRRWYREHPEAVDAWSAERRRRRHEQVAEGAEWRARVVRKAFATLHGCGWSNRGIARAIDADRKTVNRWASGAVVPRPLPVFERLVLLAARGQAEGIVRHPNARLRLGKL